jgi:hypothetical protein
MLDLVVHVTCEGEPRLPDGVRVTDPELVDPVYDAERAEVRGRFAPPPDQRSIFVTVTAPGYARAEVIAALPRRGTGVRAAVEFLPTRRVLIAVTGPRWAAQVLELEVPREESLEMKDGEWKGLGVRYWMRAKAGRRFNLNTQEILYDLRPGKYRLRLKRTPVVVREFDVARDDVRLAVDLTRADTQEIVLRGPPELSLAEATLQADWLAIGPHSHAPGEARFSVVLPGDRELVFEPRHPLARPAAPLRLVAAGDEIAVDLRLRQMVRFRLPEDAPSSIHFELDRHGVKVASGKAIGYGDGYAVPAEPGKYSLLIKPWNRDVIVRRIDVPEGGLDLGLITPR